MWGYNIEDGWAWMANPPNTPFLQLHKKASQTCFPTFRLVLTDVPMDKPMDEPTDHWIEKAFFGL